MKTYHLEILTPRGRLFEGEVVHARVPVEDGSVGILADHTAYAASSRGGPLEVRLPSGEVCSFRVGTGFFQILKNDACFLARDSRAPFLAPLNPKGAINRAPTI